MIHASSLSTCKITLIRIKYKRIHDNRMRNSPLENTFQRRSSFDNNETRALVISITGDPSSKIRPHDVYAYCTDACETLTVARGERGGATHPSNGFSRDQDVAPRSLDFYRRCTSVTRRNETVNRDRERRSLAIKETNLGSRWWMATRTWHASFPALMNNLTNVWQMRRGRGRRWAQVFLTKYLRS